MVENIKEANLNKHENGILSFEFNKTFYNLSFNINLKENTHRLLIKDLLSDTAYTSDYEADKKVLSFCEPGCKEEKSATELQDLIKNFVEQFISRRGRLLIGEYKVQKGFLIKFEYTLKGIDHNIVYATSENEDESFALERRDKSNTNGIVIPSENFKCYPSSKAGKCASTVDINNPDIDKGDSEELIPTIIGMIQKRQINKALKMLKEALEKTPDNVPALEQMAIAYNELRLAKECLETANKILAINKDNVPAMIEKSLALRQLRFNEEALELCNQALKLEPKNERIYYAKSFILNCKGFKFNDEALNVIEKSLAINPNYALALSMKALIYSEQKKYSEAIILFDKAILADPHDPKTLNYKGLCYSNMGKGDLAMAEFKKSFEVDPEFSVAYDNYGECFITKGKWDCREALKYFTKAYEMNPNNTHAIFNMCKCYRGIYKDDEALKYIDEIIKVEENYSWAYNMKAEIHKERKEYQKALDAAKLAVLHKPRYHPFMIMLGWCYYNMNIYDDAFDIFEDVYGDDESNFEAKRGRDMAMDMC